jgi:hypothetical protein
LVNPIVQGLDTVTMIQDHPPDNHYLGVWRGQIIGIDNNIAEALGGKKYGTERKERGFREN